MQFQPVALLHVSVRSLSCMSQNVGTVRALPASSRQAGGDNDTTTKEASPNAHNYTMGDLVAWLGAIHKTCGGLLLGPLDDDYGVETKEDLLNLDEEDIDTLVA
eukprot:COSAG01_NODE_49216_length_374_cov_0.734545_1_plen_103_part_10